VGEEIGYVTEVLKHTPGKVLLNSPAMLHIEQYTKPLFAPIWELDADQPDGLVDPTDHLLEHVI
jgi:hypothetical protein